jgi:hypothetical protein
MDNFRSVFWLALVELGCKAQEVFYASAGLPRRPHKYLNYFHHDQLTLADPVVIIEGFARKSEEF